MSFVRWGHLCYFYCSVLFYYLCGSTQKKLIPRESKRLDYNCKVWGERVRAEKSNVLTQTMSWRKCFSVGDLLSDTTSKFNWERHEMICMEHMDLYEWSRWIHRCFEFLLCDFDGDLLGWKTTCLIYFLLSKKFLSRFLKFWVNLIFL